MTLVRVDAETARRTEDHPRVAVSIVVDEAFGQVAGCT